MKTNNNSKINVNGFFVSAKAVPVGKVRAFANAYTTFLALRDEYSIEDEECLQTLHSAFGILTSIDSIAVKAGNATMFTGFVSSVEEKESVMDVIDLAVRKRLAYQAMMEQLAKTNKNRPIG